MVSGKKRKKGNDTKDFLKGVRIRKSPSTGKEAASKVTAEGPGKAESVKKEDKTTSGSPAKVQVPPLGVSKTASPPPAGLGLGAYSSDEDD